mgnify:CR=1 FL=1
MSGSRLWTLVRLDLTQRVRSVAWYVMLGVFAAILVVVLAKPDLADLLPAILSEPGGLRRLAGAFNPFRR